MPESFMLEKEIFKAEKELKFGKAKEFFDLPQNQFSLMVNFSLEKDFPGGRELKPGERFVFIMPESFSGKILRDVVLEHRKDFKYSGGVGKKEYDSHGAYSKVEVHDRKTNKWYGWQDPNGYNPIKFAEQRPAHDPENEVLHDWLAMVGELDIDAIAVENMGNHPELSTSQIHSLEATFFPEKEKVGEMKEKIFTPGTFFIDIKKEKNLPTYGGGSQEGGKYPYALPLGGFSQEVNYPLTREVEKGMRHEGNRLFISLLVGKKLLSCEVSIGDTHIQPEKKRLGWAKLYVGIKNKEGKVDYFMERVNIPPQGVLSGGPKNPEYVIGEGDELVIESRDDESYLMGYRLIFEKE